MHAHSSPPRSPMATNKIQPRMKWKKIPWNPRCHNIFFVAHWIFLLAFHTFIPSHFFHFFLHFLFLVFFVHFHTHSCLLFCATRFLPVIAATFLSIKLCRATQIHTYAFTQSHTTHTQIFVQSSKAPFCLAAIKQRIPFFWPHYGPRPTSSFFSTHTHPCMCTLAKYCALPVGGDCYAASATCRNTKFASSPLHSFLSLFTQCSATTSAHTSVSHSWIFLQHKHTSAASAYKPLHTPDDACLSLCDCCLLLRYFQPPPTVVRKRKCIQNLIWQPWSWAKSAEGSRSTKWMGGKKDTTTTKNAC